MKLYLSILLIGIAFLFSCNRSNTESVPSKIPPMKLKVEKVQVKDMVDRQTFFGIVKLRRQAFLASQFAGRLSEFNLLPGDRVSAGQKIGVIVPALREALLQSRDGQTADKAKYLDNEIRLIDLASPMQGEVLAIFRHSGDVVGPGEHIAEIGDLSLLDVVVDLPVHLLTTIGNANKFDVRIIDYPHDALSLPIEAVVGRTDENKQTTPVRLRLENKKHLFRPGMKAEIEIPVQQHRQALVVPRSALVEEEGTFSVFVFESGRAKKTAVQTGIFTDGSIEIVSGLKTTDTVITEKVYSLVDDMEVSIR